MTEEHAGFEASAPQDDGRTSLALALGLAAAIAAGGMWAVLVFVTNLEVGYAAWGVGVLVGVAMTRATRQRTQQLAYAAAVFALLGLVAGKAFIFAGSSGMIAEELSADEEVMRGAIAWQMYAERALDQETLAEIDRVEAGQDTLSDAAWASMLEQADVRLASMTEQDRAEAAGAAARTVMHSMGMFAGIRAQLSAFDLLWVFLAVGTAYRMLAPAKESESVELQQA
ncbi:MAG TPA: hypothetical protein VFZ24_07800 [Longimicrobiales bacterium]